MATEECDSQSAPIEENGESKKRKEKRGRPPGTEGKPIRKVTRTHLTEVNLGRVLAAREAKCGENLTASNLFSFVINRMAVQILDARARRKTFLMSSLFHVCDSTRNRQKILLMILKAFDLRTDVRG
jgi:hypothetical protein